MPWMVNRRPESDAEAADTDTDTDTFSSNNNNNNNNNRKMFAGIGANFTGGAANLEYYLTCTVSQPLWDDEDAPFNDYVPESTIEFPDDFKFLIEGVNYTHVTLNVRSGFAFFIPESETVAPTYTEYVKQRMFVSFGDDDVPMVWSTVKPDQVDRVRFICAWCDEFDERKGVVRWQLLDRPGARVFRVSWIGLVHQQSSDFLPTSLTMQLSLYEGTGGIKVQYMEHTAEVYESAALGVQINSRSGLDVALSDLSDCLEEASVVYVPVGADPCANLYCGLHGVCLDGLCQCRDSYYGEYCLIPPTEPALETNVTTTDCATNIRIYVVLDKLNARFGFGRQDVITVVGPARLSVHPPAKLTELLYYVTLIPDQTQDPGDVYVFAEPDAFVLSLPSNIIHLRYSPTVTLDPVQLTHGGVAAVLMVVTFSNLVKDFNPTRLSVNGSVELNPDHMVVLETDRIWEIQVVPLLANQTDTSTIWLEWNAVNNASSDRSEDVVMTFEPARVLLQPETVGEDVDQSGAVYFLGSNRTTTVFSNPGDPGTCRDGAACVTVRRSSSATPLDRAWCITSRRTSDQCHTAALPNSWWDIDFGEYMRMKVDDYMIRDGDDFHVEMLRNWELQGSDDGLTWTTLSVHVNDESLTGPLDTHLFAGVSAERRAVDVGYRHIRVLQTDVNAGNSLFLNIGGLELYGELFATQDDCHTINCGFFGVCNKDTDGCLCTPGYQGPRCLSAPEARRSFHNYTGDFDDEGAFFYLGTNRWVDEWVNPVHLGWIDTFRSSDGDGRTGVNGSSCLVGLHPATCHTSNELEPYWGVDLTVDFRMQVNAYSLRDGNNNTNMQLRYWVLEASNDFAAWTVLSDHFNDESLVDRLDTHTWFLDKRSDAFRYFRIRMYDRNDGLSFHLALSGFELYGTLYDTNDECTATNCNHNGNCTSPGVCDCADGWGGSVCLVPPPPPALPPPGPADLTPLYVVLALIILVALAILSWFVYRRYRRWKIAKELANRPRPETPVTDVHRRGFIPGTIAIPLTGKFGKEAGMFNKAPMKKQRSKTHVPMNMNFSFKALADANGGPLTKANIQGGRVKVKGKSKGGKMAWGKGVKEEVDSEDEKDRLDAELRAKEEEELKAKGEWVDPDAAAVVEDIDTDTDDGLGDMTHEAFREGEASDDDGEPGAVLDMSKAADWANQLAEMMDEGRERMDRTPAQTPRSENGLRPPSLPGSVEPHTPRSHGQLLAAGDDMNDVDDGGDGGDDGNDSDVSRPKFSGSDASTVTPPAAGVRVINFKLKSQASAAKELVEEMTQLAAKRGDKYTSTPWGRRRARGYKYVADSRASRPTVPVINPKQLTLPIVADGRYTDTQKVDDDIALLAMAKSGEGGPRLGSKASRLRDERA